jgi:hypothetical protein
LSRQNCLELCKRASLLRQYLGDDGLPGSLALGTAISVVPSVIESQRVINAHKKHGENANPASVAAGNGLQGAVEGALLAGQNRGLGKLSRRIPAYAAFTGGTDAILGGSMAELEKSPKKKGS